MMRSWLHLASVALPIPLVAVPGGLCWGQEEGLIERAQEIAAMLPEAPAAPGPPLDDRVAWEALAEQEAGQGVIARAQALLSEPIPEQTDDLYLDFSRTGNRRRYETVAFARRGRLSTLALAECLERKRRFLQAIEELVPVLCSERTWVLPAHDGSLVNFRGEVVDIDLFSSAFGWEMALLYRLLGNDLNAECRELIRSNVMRRVVSPFRDMVSGLRGRNWWLTTTNNWNAVCLAGVTGAALALVESREERGLYVAAAEYFSENFLRGFTADGYCSEGLGYWNYGFGNYVLLAETVLQATGGQLDLLARPEAQMPAQFGARIEIIGGVYPAFADCSISARPDAAVMYYLNRRLGLGLPGYDKLPVSSALGSLARTLLLALPNSASSASMPQTGEGPGMRTYFDEAGVLICRPAPGSKCQMGVALKGGHNAEHHNHNDLGSYVVVVGDRALLLDPGAEVYTARTFSSRRYESKLLNSYGHPVPVVAGALQSEGAQARAEVLAAEFSEGQDVFRLDLRSAYDVPELQRLERTFTYSREGGGELVVSDRVEFASPQAFATALITLGQWHRLEDGSLLIYDEDRAVRVAIECRESEFEVVAETIEEDGPHPTRLGINLGGPVTAATVTVRVTPVEPLPAEEVAGVLPNGGFEHGGWRWRLPADGMGTISPEDPASGERCLRISDHSEQAGSDVTSSRVVLSGGQTYELRGQYRRVSGSGLGLYVLFHDDAGNRLNPEDERGWVSPIGSLGEGPTEWH